MLPRIASRSARAALLEIQFTVLAWRRHPTHPGAALRIDFLGRHLMDLRHVERLLQRRPAPKRASEVRHSLCPGDGHSHFSLMSLNRL
jgi:hypothetical protein